MERVTRQLSFRAQILTLFSVGFLALTVIAQIATSWFAIGLIRDGEISEGKKITAAFAKASVLALTYGSAGQAKQAADATLGFPSVIYIAIYDANHNDLIKEGASSPDWQPDTTGRDLYDVEIARETADVWHFIGPVYSTDETDSPFKLKPAKKEFLGLVHVVRTKETIKTLQRALLIGTALVMVFATTIIGGLLLKTINRIVKPLENLSETLERASQDDTSDIHAIEEGPPEIVKMAKEFNRHMARWRDRQNTLEVEIERRTQQAVQARDEAISANRHKSDFLGAISHDLRTPLHAIILSNEGVLEQLEAGAFSDIADLQDDLRTALQSADQLQNLIEQLLDSAKIERGQIDLKIEATDIAELVREIAETMFPSIAKQNNELQVISCCDRSIDIDRSKLRRVILNLLNNAAKFTHNGRIELKVDCSANVLGIVVADSGIGIAPEHHKLIFEPFRQVEISSNRPYGGVGLGLSISKQFVEGMGGSIVIESEIGSGTTFKVNIPFPIKADS